MKKNIYLLIIVANFILIKVSFSQPDVCNGANPFCTGTTYNFPATSNGSQGQSGIDYGCLSSVPNPVWYYLKAATSGSIVLSIAGANTSDDIDFACWGPFTSATGGCVAGLTNSCGFFGCTDNTTPPPFGTNYPSGNLVDCSYDAQSAEVCTIPNAITGEYYLVLITNFNGNVTNIIFNQTGGNGATDCSIVQPCVISQLTANPSTCNNANNTYSLTGSITFTNAPTTGSLIVTTSCGGTKVFAAPFTSPSNYTLTGLTANFGSCVVNAVFSAANTCTKTIQYNAPAACTTTATCLINQFTANPSLCNSINNTFSVTGSVSFTNTPTTGSLVITSVCGGSQQFTAPFTSPLTYTLINLSANGNNCSVNAVFSAANSCTQTATFAAPSACASSSTCLISQLSITPSPCNPSTGNYFITGSVTFTNAPTTGSLVVSTSSGANAFFTAPFLSPLSFTVSSLIPNGTTNTVTAVFSSQSQCNYAASYLSPPLCSTCTANVTNNSPICEGQQLKLSSTVNNASSYAWYNSNGVLASSSPTVFIPNATPSMSGIYSFVANVPNSGVCTATTMVSIVGLPQINYEIILPSTADDYLVNVITDTVNTAKYYWLINQDTLKSLNYYYDFKDVGSYQLCYYIENSLGCSKYYCENISLKGDWAYYIPNTFSPNNDGINDVFQGKGIGIDKMEMWIYSRWGDLVFHNNELQVGWNGNYLGKSQEAQQDVYSWKIELKDIFGRKHSYVGHVTLLR